MVCLGFEPGAAGWKAETNPLGYGGTPKVLHRKGFTIQILIWHKNYKNMLHRRR